MYRSSISSEMMVLFSKGLINEGPGHRHCRVLKTHHCCLAGNACEVLCLLMSRVLIETLMLKLRNGCDAEPIGSKELQLTDSREPSREEV